MYENAPFLVQFIHLALPFHMQYAEKPRSPLAPVYKNAPEGKSGAWGFWARNVYLMYVGQP